MLYLRGGAYPPVWRTSEGVTTWSKILQCFLIPEMVLYPEYLTACVKLPIGHKHLDKPSLPLLHPLNSQIIKRRWLSSNLLPILPARPGTQHHPRRTRRLIKRR